MLTTATARAAYEATTPAQLSIAEGDGFDVYDVVSDPGWLGVRPLGSDPIEFGDPRLIPTSYVVVAAATSVSEAAAASGASARSPPPTGKDKDKKKDKKKDKVGLFISFVGFVGCGREG